MKIPLNTTVAWTSSGTSDFITADLDPEKRGGVQITASGITLESATIKVVTDRVEQTHTAETGSGAKALVGQDWAMSAITITGVAAGTYNVTFRQL